MNMAPWVILLVLSPTESGSHSFTSERGFATLQECKAGIFELWQRNEATRFLPFRCVSRDGQTAERLPERCSAFVQGFAAFYGRRC